MSEKIDALLEERAERYGGTVTTMERTAQVWSGIFGFPVNALQVALAMAGLKLVRAEINPEYEDSFDDAHGYVDIGEQCAGHKPLTKADPCYNPDTEEYVPEAIIVNSDEARDRICDGQANGCEWSVAHTHGSSCQSACLVCRGLPQSAS